MLKEDKEDGPSVGGLYIALFFFFILTQLQHLSCLS